jgi:hypothetical protein
LVDSSHSNNVVIGKFVNSYMDSPFGKEYRIDGEYEGFSSLNYLSAAPLGGSLLETRQYTINNAPASNITSTNYPRYRSGT